MAPVADIGSTVRLSTSGALGANERLKLANLEGPKTVSATGSTQAPGLVTQRQGHKTVVVPSTRPGPPPTFQPTTDHSSVIKMPYAGPVYYTKAGSLSRPIQDLGNGALVRFTV